MASCLIKHAQGQEYEPMCCLGSEHYHPQANLCTLPALAGMAYSLTLKMEAKYSSETSIDFQGTAQCYISEDRTLLVFNCLPAF
jgi:hypothetical protein